MSISKNFDNQLWYPKTTGSGTAITADSGQTFIGKAALNDVGYRRFYMSAMPGEIITFTVNAKNRSEDGFAGFAAMWIDIPIDSIRNEVAISSDEYMVYTIQAVVPYSNDGPVRVALGLGSFGLIDGSAEYLHPVMTRTGPTDIMRGAISFPDGGGFSVFGEYDNYGIGTLVWNPTFMTLDITSELTHNFQNGGEQFRPLPVGVGWHDGNMTEGYAWTVASTATGIVRIQAIVSSTGVPVDLSSSTNQQRFASFVLSTTNSG